MTWEGLTPPYSTIVADPPWSYKGDDWESSKGEPWRSTSPQSYSLLPVESIRDLPVGELAALDAHLYLWAVVPLMREAYSVIEAWGFTPDTLLTWCKPGAGLGAGFRCNTEHLIVARRGHQTANPSCEVCGGRARGGKKCACAVPDWRVKGLPSSPRRPFTTTAEGSWYEASRARHSEKPALFADLIERMSPGPYVELFARAPRLGWDSWGLGYETAVA